MDNTVELSEMNLGYDGKRKRLEVSGFSRDIHDRPGLYLQRVEGCGYDVYHLTLEEAERLAAILVQVVAEVRAEFASGEAEA